MRVQKRKDHESADAAMGGVDRAIHKPTLGKFAAVQLRAQGKIANAQSQLFIFRAGSPRLFCQPGRLKKVGRRRAQIAGVQIHRYVSVDDGIQMGGVRLKLYQHEPVG